MNDPFSGTKAFAGRNRTTGETSKLPAAKSALREHLRGLGAPGNVTLIAFNETAEIVFSGMSTESARIEAALEELEARGGTDLAGALEKALECTVVAADELFFRALVISDGLSDPHRAREAAIRVAAKGIIIDVILIDPSIEGEEVARAVALNGNVSAVRSEKGLDEQVSRAAATQERQRVELEAVVAEYEAEKSKLSLDVPPMERLAFSAWYPAIVAPGQWNDLGIFLHLARLQAEIDSRIEALSTRRGVAPALSTSTAGNAIPRGTWLTLSPHVPGLTFNPPSISVAWYEDVQEVAFRFRPEPGISDRSVFGSVNISAGAMPVAQLGLNVNVRSDLEGMPVAVRRASLFQQVFASYAREDAPIVEACAAVYWALGIYVYIDRKSIRSGQQWWLALQRFIEKSDVFQLYWSSNAAESEPVRHEYEYALGLHERKGHGFIRPMFWQDPSPEIPAALAQIHFAPLDLDTLSRQTGRPLTRTAAITPSISSSAAALVPPLSVSVVPLLQSAAPEVVAQVRQDVGIAVSFLEEVTGLRYYPVTTLLVDEHVVRTVRAEHTVDLEPEEDGVRHQALALADFLRAVCLDFHVRRIAEPALGTAEPEETFARSFGAGDIMTMDQFEWLRDACETFPRIEDVVMPRWRQALAALEKSGEGIHPRHSLTGLVMAVLDEILIESDFLRSNRLPLMLSGDRRETATPLVASFVQAGGRAEDRGAFLALHGPGAAFRRLLRDIRGRLAELAPEVDSHDSSSVAVLTPYAEECLKLAGLADSLVCVLVDESSPQGRQLQDAGFDTWWGSLGRWYAEVLMPRWRYTRAGLIANGLADGEQLRTIPDSVNLFLTLASRALREGLRHLGDSDRTLGYSLSRASWQRVQAMIPGMALRIGREEVESDESVIYPSGRFSEIVEAFELSSRMLVASLSRIRGPRTGVQRVFTEVAQTYGIFAPARSQSADRALFQWSDAHGISPHLTLPDTARVLFSLGARARLEETLREESGPRIGSGRLASLFQQCVLVHEHFHAILETGLDTERQVAPGPSAPDQWNDASRLNESLAAWMELHFARDQEDLRRLVLDYITSGDFPVWPYAGALKIEAEYESRGLEAVKDWIDRLRKDPAGAVAAFDLTVPADPSAGS